MNRGRWLTFGTLAVVIAAGSPLATVARGAEAAPSMDHAAMAASYESEAKAAQEKAAEHEAMMGKYKNLPLPKGSAVTKQAMTSHCQKLVAGYKSIASEAGSLAKEHQQMEGH